MQNFRLGLINQFQGSKQLLLVKDILGKPPEERHESDLKYIAEIIKDHRYFTRLVIDDKERLEFATGCAKYLKYRFQKRGTQVFAHGDPGSEFFIVYKGKVTVFTPKTEEEWNAVDSTTAKNKREAFDKYTNHLKSNLQFPNGEARSAIFQKKGSFERIKVDFTPLLLRFKNDILRKDPELTEEDIIRKNILEDKGIIYTGEQKYAMTYEERLLLINSKRSKPYFENGLASFKAINSLGEGGYFGEIALIFRINRTASIIAAEDTHLFYLSADDYKVIFSSQINNVIKKVDFGVRVFPNLSRKMIMKFCYLLEEKTFQHGEIIYREGDNPDALYLIKSGEVQISRLIEGESPSKHDMMVKRKSHFRQRLVVNSILLF